MTDKDNQEHRFKIEEFSKKSEEFYTQIKIELEAKFKGKYAALDFELKKYWIGETATDAITSAKSEFPDKLFYLVQVGSPAPFSIQSITTLLHTHRTHDFARSY